MVSKISPPLRLEARAVCDLELLATGAFSALDRFICRADYERVLEEMRLAHGTLIPIPVTLPVERSDTLQLDREPALRDQTNNLLATLFIEEIYEWDDKAFAGQVLGTTDEKTSAGCEKPALGGRSI
jgi:sulfate adenylyltransferase